MATTDSGQRAERVKSAAQMYVYGYPLVYCLREVAGFAEGHSSLPLSAPWNEFGYARELLGPETTFVSPNNDTLYVLAALDLRPGPLVLHVPDTADRYYVLQFVDAWTNNFAYIGRRATGTGERRFLLAGPGDTTEAPEGIELVRAPTNVVMIAGRVQINGVADAPAVHAIQDQFTLTHHAHIHDVSCTEYRRMTSFSEQLATVAEGLADVVDGKSTTDLAVPLSKYAKPGSSINVHKYAAPYPVIACGDIPAP